MNGPHWRILIVDDDVRVADSIARVLRLEGWDITVQTRPSEALALIRATPHAFDLLLTDVRMPEQTGTTFVTAVRAVCPDLPVIFMSGHVDDPELALHVHDGPDPFLSKPFTPEALVDAVNARLRRGSPSVEAPDPDLG